ncbi:MAG TPA: 5-oxoprolinase subunit PxpA [Gemmatimonadaceae bacterium]|nr:5-oxoprolinase subunit PxpA [Gemmatimonadaceae bacterium]
MTATAHLSIDLNADLGEHDGEGAAADNAILDLVTSANISCGGHAGSPGVMRLTVAAAKERGVAIGAHPGYPDRANFGRVELDLPSHEIGEMLEKQIRELASVCRDEHATLRYVKPHGAMYNRAARDDELARVIAACIVRIDPALHVLALAGSALERAAHTAGLQVTAEAFIDRGYLADGMLVPRGHRGDLLTDPQIAAARAVRMVTEHSGDAIDGTKLQLFPGSLCAHGDGAHALEMVKSTRKALGDAGIVIEAFAR